MLAKGARLLQLQHRCAPRPHKHFSDSTNLSNLFGPVVLTPLTELPKMSVKDKKEFWGPRRRAVGGRTEEDSGSSEADEEDEVADERADEEEHPEMPDVGGGRGAKGLAEGTLQPICYPMLPVLVHESLGHAFWGMSAIDMTPGIGDLCINNVTMNVGYMGICHTDAQKCYIMKRLQAEMLEAMTNPESKVYSPAFAQEKGVKREQPDDPDKPKETKAAKVITNPPNEGGSTLNTALQQMLAAAKQAADS